MSAPDDCAAFQRRISNVLTSGEPTTFSGKVYRSASPKYATTTDLMTGKGAKLHGGRWNPAGAAAVYASLSIDTALQEALSHVRYCGLPVDRALPRTFCVLELALADVLDLRIGNIRKRLRFSLQDMVSTDWRRIAASGRVPRTQLLGNAAHSLNLQAVIVPSGVSKTAANIVVFPDNLTSTSKMMTPGGKGR